MRFKKRRRNAPPDSKYQAVEKGFEPLPTVPETAVLPLDDSPIVDDENLTTLSSFGQFEDMTLLK